MGYEARPICQKVTVNKIISEIKQHLIFYRYSDGDITYSGGEPTYQECFLRTLVYTFYDMGIHQTIETCSYFNRNNLEDIFKKLDFIFIDIKHMDRETHKLYTGCDNKIILDNIEHLGKLNKEILIRIPLIKDINDSEENISKTAYFIKNNAPSAKVEILPYHSLGNYKYDNLGLSEYKNLYITPDEKDIEKVKDIMNRFGIGIVDFK